MINGVMVGKVSAVELSEPQMQSEETIVYFTLTVSGYDNYRKERTEKRFLCVAGKRQHEFLQKQAVLGYRVAVVFNDLKADLHFEAAVKVLSVSSL